MKKFVIIFVILVIVVGFTYYCSNIGENQTEKLFSENEMEMMKPNLLRVAPSEVKSFNSYKEDKVDYDAYYMFDRNAITGWIGDLNKDYGRAVILFYESIERDFDITHIRIKPGIENGRAEKNDYSRPKVMEFQFYKLIEVEKKTKENSKSDPQKDSEANNINSDSTVIPDNMVVDEELASDEPDGPVAVDDYSDESQESSSNEESGSIEIAPDENNEGDSEGDNEGDNKTINENSNDTSKQRRVELVHKLDINIEDTNNWQINKIDQCDFDFDFINVYVKDAYKGNKFPEKVAISEIELLTTGAEKQTSKNNKYEYRYDKLKLSYENQDKIEFLKGKSTEIFYPEYKFVFKSSRLEEVYRGLVKRKEIFNVVVPTFEKLMQQSNFGLVPKDQLSYINSLPVSFDATKVNALKNASSRSFKHRSTFFIYLENPEFGYSELEDSPIYFPFMKYLGTSFINLKLNKRLKDASYVLNKRLRSLFKSNKGLEYFFLVRTHNNKLSGNKKYVLYYNRNRVGFINSSAITGSSNDADPLCIFIYDKYERLVKVIHKEYGKEDHYFIIWDKNNKMEKVLIMEIGDFGLKKIQKVFAEKSNG